MFLGLGLMVNAGLALQFSDEIEEFLKVKPTAEEEQRLRASLPTISTVERPK
jgi:hypothetical protein